MCTVETVFDTKFETKQRLSSIHQVARKTPAAVRCMQPEKQALTLLGREMDVTNKNELNEET